MNRRAQRLQDQPDLEDPDRARSISRVALCFSAVGGRFRGEDDMVTAIVFIKADVARIPEVAEQVAAIDGVSEVYSVTGGLDLIALVRVAHHDDLASVIPDHVNRVPGVLSTETHIAFRAYSTHDLEAAFSLGSDDGV